MARKSEKVGRGPCPGCGERVTFHRTAGGMLNYECDACDHSAYAQKGGQSERDWLARIDKPAEKGEPEKVQQEISPPISKPQQKPKASVFALGDL